jgi:hypothetical protein
VEIAQVLRAWYGIMQLFTWGSWWERWDGGGYINRLTLLSSILRSGYLRRFGGGWKDGGMTA